MEKISAIWERQHPDHTGYVNTGCAINILQNKEMKEKAGCKPPVSYWSFSASQQMAAGKPEE